MSDINYKIITLPVVSSTNDYLKQLARNGADMNTVVIADEQTAGKGTKNRSFTSKKGGVYLSILVKPENTGFDSTLVTPMTAVAIKDAIKQISNINADIKWVNDVFINGKKVAGILCESVIMPDGSMPYIIVGIGVNLFLPQGGFDQEIEDIATCVFEVYNENFKKQFIGIFLEKFFNYYKDLNKKTFLEKYRKHSCVVGKKIQILLSDKIIEATALKIDDNCRLVIELEDKTIRTLSSGDVSIKLQ